MPAITTPWNKSLVLRGVTAATVPTLRGDVVFQSETPFRLKSLKSAPGVLTQHVIKAYGNGLLTFAYSIALTETDYDAELRFAVAFSLPGFAVTFVDFRMDKQGMTPPNYYESSKLEGYSFKFTYGIAVGRDSRSCFLSTNAREFQENRGEIKLITGQRSVTLDGPSPLMTVPLRWTEAKNDEPTKPSLPQPAAASADESESSPSTTSEKVST